MFKRLIMMMMKNDDHNNDNDNSDDHDVSGSADKVGCPHNKNIAKGTTDPRVKFISQVHISQFINLDQITISKSRLSINFKISTKHQHLD